MDPSAAHPTAWWIYVIPLIAIALAIRRTVRARRLRVERLWILPAVILGLGILAVASQPPASPGAIALSVAALALGAGLGFWRGRLTRITVDPVTRQLTSQASPLGMILVLAIFALRFGLRTFGGEAASALHVSALAITDALLLLAVGLVCVQRIEMGVRAQRLLKAATGS